MAPAVDYKLKEHEETNNQQDRVLTTMFTDVQEMIQEIGINSEETQQTNKELGAMGQELMGLGEYIRSEVWTSVNTIAQNYTEPKTQKEPMVRESHPKLPYLVGARVEYPIGRPNK